MARVWQLLVVIAALPSVAHAHSFARSYNIPVPFWLYAWGAIAALLLSFLMLAWSLNAPTPARQHTLHWHHAKPRSQQLTMIASAAALLVLLLTIASGIWGSADAYRNLNMTLFWIGIVLILPYLTVIAGNSYALINPWRLLSRPAKVSYPAHWHYWPACIAYVVFIWIELFAGFGPRALAISLIIYSLYTVIAVRRYGLRDWLRYGDVFALMLRLIGKMAPLSYRGPSSQARYGSWTWRWPLSGLLQSRANHASEVLFILFMLSSTAFDGLHATRWWAERYWVDGFALLEPWLGSNIVTAYPTLKAGFVVYETLALVLSPVLYFGLYVACLWLAKRLLRSDISLHELILRFAYALTPIAVVYHASHYFTLVITQGSQLPRLASDPFGWGWNLFGSASANPWIILPDMNWVWHSQVALIILGHIAGVYAAHQEALRCFATAREALISQLPMLVFMMALTVFGLWILAMPLNPAG